MTGRTLLLFAGCLILFIWGTWQVPLLGPDEPRYAQVAREMFESGDYFVPRLGGFAWFEKPILLYWLMCVSYAIFGVHEFAARLPSVLAGLSTIWFIYHSLKKLSDHNSALISAALLGSTAFVTGFAHAATFDMLLTFCVTSALCCFFLYDQDSTQKKWLRLLYAFAGLGVLAKGFVALIIIGLTIFCYLLWTGKWKNFFAFRPLEGLLITCAVIALWFLPVSLIYGYRFWDEFVIHHHFVRYTSSYYHRSQGPLFYIPVLIAGTYPWTFAPLLAKPDKNNPLVRFALSWLIAPLLFFSLSETKLPGYILPVVPAFAILAGSGLSKLQNKSRLVLAAIVLQVMMIGALVWGGRKYGVPVQPLIWMAALLAVITAIAIVLVVLKKWTAASIAYSSILLAAMVLFVHGLYPRLAWSDSRELSVLWSQQHPGNQKLVPYNVYDFGPVFYTNGRLELNPQGYPQIVTNASQLHRYLKQQAEAHVYTGNDDLDWMQRAEFWKVHDVIRGRERSIVELRLK